MEIHKDVACSPQTSIPPPLEYLPPPLLALVASHLPPNTLLRLQRCSSALHRLRADESYMLVAWSAAEVKLCHRLRVHEWAVPEEHCIYDGRFVASYKVWIPVTVWQSALPAYRAILDRTASDEHSGQYLPLRQLVESSQPTEWICVTRSEKCSCHGKHCAVDADSGGTERVEVLRDVDCEQLGAALPWSAVVDVRCRLVLQACPYLQHLSLDIDSYVFRVPRHDDTFALIPLLRSLHLELGDSEHSEKRLFDYQRMLDSLPHLTSLHCQELRGLCVADLLAIVCHSTLDDVRIVMEEEALGDSEWIGEQMVFPVNSVEEDERALEELAAYGLDGDIEAESDEADTAIDYCTHASQPTFTGDQEEEMLRVRTALTRSQPTQRSCEVRLSLADWLHRRLRRGTLWTDDRFSPARHPKSLLRHRRRQVAIIRLTLQRQLSEHKAASAAQVTAASSVDVESSETSRANKRARVAESTNA